MELWMYLFVIGMFLVAIVATVWITLWTIQRGQRGPGSTPRRDQQQERPRRVEGDET